MTNQNSITTTINSLTVLAQNPCTSERASRSMMTQALVVVRHADLDEDTIATICSAIRKAANPSGYYYDTNGIKAGIEALEALQAEEVEAETTIPLNRANLKNLVSTGSIFNVKFIKRTTGELRSMTCRMGVQKHLKGGAKAFNDKSKDLLTVFDMQAKGYRSIPVDGIQSLSINGQSFSFGGA